MSKNTSRKRTCLRVVRGLLPFVCSTAVFLTLLFISRRLYAGVINVSVFSCVVIIGGWVSWYLLRGEPRRILLPALGVLLANILVIGIFWGNLPKYTLSQAAQYIMVQEENVTVTPNPEYRVMNTAEPLNLLVDKGYVFFCTCTSTGTQKVVFFHPITGAYYEIK